MNKDKIIVNSKEFQRIFQKTFKIKPIIIYNPSINEKLLNQGMMNMMCYNNIPYILEYISSENNGDLASLRNEVSQYDLDVLRDILSSINEHLVNLNE